MTSAEDRRPADLIGQAAELIRDVNHATLRGAGGMTDASNVYDAIGGLELLVARLPQLLRQLELILEKARVAGTLTGPSLSVEQVAAKLAGSARALTAARQLLQDAHSTAGPIGGEL